MNCTPEVVKPRRLLQLPTVGPDAAASLLRRAIATQTCVSATYNRGRVKLAPYVLYEKDDALFLDAVTLEREGRPPREPKLGAFRLSGLSGLRIGTERFEPTPDVPIDEGRYAGPVLVRL